MALNLLDALKQQKRTLHVWNRSKQKTEAFVGKGAVSLDSVEGDCLAAKLAALDDPTLPLRGSSRCA